MKSHLSLLAAVLVAGCSAHAQPPAAPVPTTDTTRITAAEMDASQAPHVEKAQSSSLDSEPSVLDPKDADAAPRREGRRQHK